MFSLTLRLCLKRRLADGVSLLVLALQAVVLISVDLLRALLLNRLM
jgi:hypothetical protein